MAHPAQRKVYSGMYCLAPEEANQLMQSLLLITGRFTQAVQFSMNITQLPCQHETTGYIALILEQFVQCSSEQLQAKISSKNRYCMQSCCVHAWLTGTAILSSFKGTVSRDFLHPVFFHQSVHSGPTRDVLGPF